MLLLAVCLGLLIAPPCYNTWARGALESYVAQAPRGPDGVLLGGAPVRIDRGRPRACLLLHGFMGTPADFGELPQAIERAGWDVCAPLLPGHGTDPRDLESLTADAMLEGVEAELADLQRRHEQVVVVGFSLGGALGLLLAEQHDADGLVLVNPFFQTTYKLYYVLPPRWWNALLRGTVDYVVRPGGIVRVNRPEAKKQILVYRVVPTRAVQEVFELGDRARSAQPRDMPMLMLLSKDDRTASPSLSREVYDRTTLTRKTIRSFDRSDHILLRDYDREETIAEILQFLHEIQAAQDKP